MGLLKLLPSLLLSAATVSAGRSRRHVDMPDLSPRIDTTDFGYIQEITQRANSQPLFLNSNTSKFAVDGTKIPDVAFDVGESYAGMLPISSDPKEENNLFWWFFPSTAPEASKEILIWLNGGPGCSSFEGLIQENGPFLWQYGTLKPVPNPWAWNKLTNVIWVEQPVGTGFSIGTPTATSEDDVAKQFLGFWKNWVDTFGIQGYKVYIAGESYAGMYCPYIANAMLDAKDANYYNVSGMLIYDPVIGVGELQGSMTTVPFVDYWKGLHPFNDSFSADIHNRHQSCGYKDYIDKYLAYPPPGPQPVILPSQNASGATKPECNALFNDVADAATALNPCWDIYQVATTCPLLWDVLGFPGSIEYLPEGAQIYFDRADVKAAIHAPNITWHECTPKDVFVDTTDNSPPPSFGVLPAVIDKTQNVIISHGALDMILIANGTLLQIQNMTWGGRLGFQKPPTEPFFVPYHDEVSKSTLAASGVMGTSHTERGLTWVGVDISGHMVPQYAPTAAFRQLEFLLGRVSSMSGADPFTTNKNVSQPAVAAMGNGTAPAGFAFFNGSAANTSNATGGGNTPKNGAVKGVGGSGGLAVLASLVFGFVML